MVNANILVWSAPFGENEVVGILSNKNTIVTLCIGSYMFVFTLFCEMRGPQKQGVAKKT